MNNKTCQESLIFDHEIKLFGVYPAGIVHPGKSWFCSSCYFDKEKALNRFLTYTSLGYKEYEMVEFTVPANTCILKFGDNCSPISETAEITVTNIEPLNLSSFMELRKELFYIVEINEIKFVDEGPFGDKYKETGTKYYTVNCEISDVAHTRIVIEISPIVDEATMNRMFSTSFFYDKEKNEIWLPEEE